VVAYCKGLHVGQQAERSKDGEIEGSRGRKTGRSEDREIRRQGDQNARQMYTQDHKGM
jgi:hypothetical protein